MAENRTEVKEKGKKTEKTCLLITPIGSKDSVEYKKLEGITTNVLEPVLEKYDYNLVVAHKINNIGSIGEQVFKKILEADLVISNLTGLNPNVMYETAVSHSFGIPTIMICEGETKLPFDIIEERTVFFDNTIYGTGELKQGLDDKIASLLKDGNHDNPVYRVIERTQKISEIKDANKGSADEVILETLFEMQDSIKRLEKRTSSNARKALESRVRNSRDSLIIYCNDHNYIVYFGLTMTDRAKSNYSRVIQQLIMDLNRVPTPEELASEMNISPGEVREIIYDIRKV